MNPIKFLFILSLIVFSGCSSISLDKTSRKIYLHEESTRQEPITICDKKKNCSTYPINIKYTTREISTAYSVSRKSCFLMLTGTIDKELKEKYGLAHKELMTMECPSKYVVLNSRGGSVIDAMHIGILIRQGKLHTIFDAKSGNETSCASSCTLIFIAGTNRFAISNNLPLFESSMGFHQWSNNSSRSSGICTDTSKYRNFLYRYSSIMLPSEVANKFVEITIGTDCKKIEQITSKDLLEYGIATSIGVPAFD